MKAVSRRIMAPKRGGSMATACIAQSTLQVHGISKPIVVRFDQPQASSDGGAILLKVVDDRLGLTWRLASALRDRRQPGKVMHPLRDLLRQRVFGLACGYADCTDAARLAHDPIHKLLLERDPLAGAALGSQPTLSRFENAVGRTDLYRLGTAVADAVLIYHRERLGEGVRLITIDLDATDDPTHGQQEFALFNGLLRHVVLSAPDRHHDVRHRAAPAHRGCAAAAGHGRADPRRSRAAAPAVHQASRAVSARAAAGPDRCGLRRRQAAGLPRRGGSGVCAGAGGQPAAGQARAAVARPGAHAGAGHGGDRHAVRRDALRRPALGSQAAHHHEGRGALLSRPVAQGQSAVSGDEPAAPAGDGLHTALLRPRRYGESAQGAAAKPGPGPDQLLALHRQPAPRASLRRGLRPVPDAAGLRALHCVRVGSGVDAARTTGEDRGLGGALGAAHRVALAASLPGARHLAGPRPGADRPLTGRSPLLQLAPGRRISPTLVHLSRVQSPALIARGAIAGTPPRAIVSAAELSTLRPLRPSRPLASAFTNNPG